MIFAPTHHSHLDTGLMIRAVPECVAPQARRRRGGRLLLRQEVEGSPVRTLPQRDPDRPGTDRAQVVRPHQGSDRRRLQPRHLSRRRSLPRRMGPGVQGWRGLPLRTDGRAGRPGLHRRDGGDLRQGHEATEAGSHQDRVRRTDASRRRRVDPALQRPDRGRGHDARRRGDHRLLDRPAARGRRHEPSRSPARSTPGGDATGHSPNGDGSAPPGSGAVSNAAGPTSADDHAGRRVGAQRSAAGSSEPESSNPVRRRRMSPRFDIRCNTPGIWSNPPR